MEWQFSYTPSQRSPSSAVAPAPDGGVYYTGSPQSSQPGNKSMLSRLDSNGSTLWSIRQNLPIYRLTSDEEGNAYGCGENPSSGAITVGKWSENGELIWSKNFPRAAQRDLNFHDYEQAIAADSEGNTVITGVVTFDDSNYPDAHYHALLIKLDAEGNMLWTASIGEGGNLLGQGVAVDADGSIYVTANAQDSVNLDVALRETYSQEDASITPGPQLDAGPVLLKLDADGTLLWGIELDGSLATTGGVGIDRSGNVVAGTESSFLLVSIHQPFFVTRIHPEGRILSAHSQPTQRLMYPLNRAHVDKDGNVLLVGNTDRLQTEPDFRTEADVYAVKLDSRANQIWEYLPSTPAPDFGLGICASTDGKVYVIGEFGFPSYSIENGEQEYPDVPHTIRIIKLQDPE